MFDSVQHLLDGFTAIIDLLGVAILAVGALKFLIAYAKFETRRLIGSACVRAAQEARLLLAVYILVALELLIVSDVIASHR